MPRSPRPRHTATTKLRHTLPVREQWGDSPDDHTLVMVVSVWHDDDGVRARVVYGTSGLRHTRTCASIPELMTTLHTLVESWDDES
jgi:hypothetical protein